MHRKTLIAVFAAAGLSVTAAWAATPADTISARQANFKKLGRAMKGVTDQMKQSSLDVQVVQANAKIMVDVAGKVRHAFPRGTGAEAGVETAALPIIWTDNGQFNTRMNTLASATRGLQKAAATGDVAKIKAAFPAVGGACKGCHDTFKGKK
jgi:cytochrome c556